MKLYLPKIYPITDVRVSGLTHVEQVKLLANGGAKIVQIREKHLAPNEFYKQAKESVKIAESFGVKIIINDRVDIALALKADGVHLGQDDLPPEEARKILGSEAIIGVSTHSVEQARDAIMRPVDYIAVGPIFPTKSKKNPDELVGIGGLKRVRDVIGDFPLVAIGGINLDNFESVFENGANSVAVISELLKSPEKIEEKFIKFSQ